jgi:tetratricopeptide (TPR) repeat protein
MDDTLYYVESPDGQVLGPMNMMSILEGVAAGAVLEDARICEVGQQEWVDLADVAYTREVDSTPLGAEAETALPASADAWAPSREPAAPSAAPAPRTPAPAGPWTHEVQAWPQTAHEPGAAGPPPEPVAARPQAGSPAPERTREHEFVPPADQLEATVVAPGRRPPSPPSGEFSLRMEQAEPAEARARTAIEPPERKFPVPVPVLVAAALAVIGGIYAVAGGKLPGAASRSVEPAPGAPEVAAADDPVEAGWRALSAGDAATAMTELTAACEARPEDAHAHHGLGLAALEVGKLDLASAHLERAVALAPDHAMRHVDLGRVRLREGRPALAIEEAERARAIDPEEVAVLLLLGRAEAAAGRPDEAVKSLAAYVDRSPKHVEARRDLAQALAAAGRMETAAAEIAPYLETHPEDREMQVARLDWLLAVGKQATAATLYSGAAKERPDDAFSLYLSGAANTGSQDAVTQLQRSVELDPQHRDAWIRLARAEAALGRSAEAIRAMEKAFALGSASDEERTLLASFRTAAKTPAKPALARAETTTPKPAREATPAPAAPARAAAAPPPVPSLADRIGEVRRALVREDFRGVRRTLETARAELRGPEVERNLALWAAITDLEEGKLAAAQKGLEALDPTATYEGFGAGAVSNWLGRVLLARGDVRAAIGVFDQVPPDDANEYAAAQLWEGIAMSSLGMQELAQRTWSRVHEDVGERARGAGRAAVTSADFLAGAIAEAEYVTAVAPSAEFENDMYFFLGWAAREDPAAARTHFQKALEASRGREFPFSLAEAAIAGTGLGAK